MNDTDYVDIRAIHPDYYVQECWNCGHSEHRNRPFKVCPECFMGQKEVDHDGESVTDDGYVDYRLLWYGDVSMEEAHRRYGETSEEVWGNITPPDVEKRTVRV